MSPGWLHTHKPIPRVVFKSVFTKKNLLGFPIVPQCLTLVSMLPTFLVPANPTLPHFHSFCSHPYSSYSFAFLSSHVPTFSVLTAPSPSVPTASVPCFNVSTSSLLLLPQFSLFPLPPFPLFPLPQFPLFPRPQFLSIGSHGPLPVKPPQS